MFPTMILKSIQKYDSVQERFFYFQLIITPNRVFWQSFLLDLEICPEVSSQIYQNSSSYRGKTIESFDRSAWTGFESGPLRLDINEHSY